MGFGVDDPLHGEPVEPVVAEVVEVFTFGVLAAHDVADPGLVLVQVRRAEVEILVLAVSPSGELEGVQVHVLPPHHDLDEHVQIVQPGDGGHLDPTPDLWLGTVHSDLDPVNPVRQFSRCHLRSLLPVTVCALHFLPLVDPTGGRFTRTGGKKPRIFPCARPAVHLLPRGDRASLPLGLTTPCGRSRPAADAGGEKESPWIFGGRDPFTPSHA